MADVNVECRPWECVTVCALQAVKQLYSLATAALDGEPDNLRKSLKSWCSVCEELFAALPPLVASDCWEELAAGLVAAALSPQHGHGSHKLVDISEAIFNHADTQECVEWGVQLLTRPDVCAAIFRTRGGATECHHTLESAAAGRFWRGDYQAAELVYRAALQFLPEGPGEARNRTSACVAACNYALKRMVRAKEYMGCALHQIMAPPATHCLLTLQLVVEVGGSSAEVAEGTTLFLMRQQCAKLYGGPGSLFFCVLLCSNDNVDTLHRLPTR
jgi:hypothetical protein